jgi:hypothetical protein
MPILRCSRGWSAGRCGEGLGTIFMIGSERFSRYAVALSVVGHVVLLLGLTYIGASAVQPIAPKAMIVEIVPPSEAPASPAPADRELSFDGTHLESASTGSEVWSESDKGSARTGRPEPKPALPSLKQAQANLKEKRKGSEQTAQPAARPEEPETQPQADEPLLVPTTPAREPQERPNEAADQPKAGEMFAMPLGLPNGRIGGGLDAPSPKPAKLAHDDTAAFKARLSSCTHAWIPLIDDKVAIVLRISFKRDGTLASPPKLLDATLSPDAGILLNAAITALETCQPFAELPPDKYSKWKTLELVVSPIVVRE